MTDGSPVSSLLTCRRVLAGVIVLLAAVVFGCSSAPEPSAQPEQPATATAVAPTATPAGCGIAAEPGTTTQSIEVEGIDRSYRLHVPAGYDAGNETPLVFNFHGLTSTAERQERFTEMNEKADEEGFVVVTPQGLGAPSRWHVFGRNTENPDDVAFAAAVLDVVKARLCIDEDRIYAAGMSNGGGMASLLGCAMDDIFAAIAPVAASPFDLDACVDASPMPVIAFHGTADNVLPFDGGISPVFAFPSRSARDVARGWAEQNGCDLEVAGERIAEDVVLETYSGCDDDADVLLYVVEGGGHTWPGEAPVVRAGDAVTQSISATDLIWAFFEAHSKR